MLLGPLTLALKAYLSRACEIHDQARYTDPLQDSCPEFVESFLGFLKRMQNFRGIQPLRRVIVPEGFIVNKILLFHDGSSLNAAYSIYVQSRDREDPQKMDTALLRVNHKLSKRTVPVTEMISRSLGLEGLLEMVPVLIRTLKNQDFSIDVITDSLCCAELMNPAATSSVHILSSNAMMQRNMIDHLSGIFSLATINCL